MNAGHILAVVVGFFCGTLFIGIYMRNWSRKGEPELSGLALYENQNEAEADIIASLRASAKVDIMCIRGQSFTQREKPFNFILDDPIKEIRILLSDPYGDPSGTHLGVRAQTFVDADKDTYLKDVQASVGRLVAREKRQSNIRVRLHRLPYAIRTYITDENLYLSFFENGKYGSEAPIIRIPVEHVLYAGVATLFAQCWLLSNEPPR